MSTFSILPEGFRPDRIREGLEHHRAGPGHQTRGMDSANKEALDSPKSLHVIDPLPEMKATIEVRKKLISKAPKQVSKTPRQRVEQAGLHI